VGISQAIAEAKMANEDAESATTLEKMLVFYSRFNPAKVGKVNNSKKANVDRT
jgi:hypothetical protein